jgi:hypothetical protein
MLATFPLRGRLWSCCTFKKAKFPFGAVVGILFSRGKLAFSLPLEGKVSNVLAPFDG